MNEGVYNSGCFPRDQRHSGVRQLADQNSSSDWRQNGGVKMNPRITSDPNICGGEPCIKDTRIPVHVVLSHLAAGEDYDTILKNFPRPKRGDILACLEYAAYISTEKVAL